MDDYIEEPERQFMLLNHQCYFPLMGHSHRPAKLLNRYITHREGRHARVLEALNQGMNNIEEIANHAYSDTPDAHPMLKVDQTLI